MTDLSKYQLQQQDSKWQSNSTLKQRQLPTKLIKRSTKQNSSDSDSLADLSSISNPPSANSIIASPLKIDGKEDLSDELDDFYGVDHKPPAKSMFDFELLRTNQDDTNLMNKFNNSNSIIKPNEYHNVFNKNIDIEKMNNARNEQANQIKIIPSAVLVIGFSNFNSVLQEFNKFGYILEEFETIGARSHTQHQQKPLEH
ncbi:unnamed protein product [Ambrosiozyma monospora]|uniref:Unnamed protein product n=1 Tax=Ambrosiozyma monospora TaxID=43982 RepID=A0ACB5U3L3_AMBMO|nr:unnamed protein product [Ambrosiozyma monospora]